MTYGDTLKGTFHTDPSPSSRNYQKLQESLARQPRANLHGMWKELVKRVECPTCGAAPDTPCLSQAKSHNARNQANKGFGRELPGYHQERLTAAKKHFGRKK